MRKRNFILALLRHFQSLGGYPVPYSSVHVKKYFECEFEDRKRVEKSRKGDEVKRCKGQSDWRLEWIGGGGGAGESRQFESRSIICGCFAFGMRSHVPSSWKARRVELFPCTPLAKATAPYYITIWTWNDKREFVNSAQKQTALIRPLRNL